MYNLERFYLLFIVVFSLVGLELTAQKASKKSDKKSDTDSSQPFNKLQEMGGSRLADVRDDYIWGTKTAFTTTARNADLSLLSQSRYGLSQKIELSSNLLLAVYSPNIFLKYNYKKEKLWISSRHGFYFPNRALSYSESNSYLINHSDSVAIPFIACMRNELILSYPFYDKMSCNSTQPYLILSAIAGVDYGFSAKNWDATSFTAPWLEPRSSALLGKGFVANITARMDYMYYNYLKLESEIGLVMDINAGGLAFENRTVAKYFLYQNLSVSAGWMFSFANRATQPQFGIIPYFDLTLYLGTKAGKQKGLWKNKMY